MFSSETTEHLSSSVNLDMSPTFRNPPPGHFPFHQRWESMELALNDIKLALGTLKNTCNTLEAEAAKLTKEMLAMREIVDPSFVESASIGGPQRPQENPASPSSLKTRSELITPPSTPARRPGILHRVNQSVGRIVHPDHISTSIFTSPQKKVLGKRSALEDNDDSTDESVNSTDRPDRPMRANKRVRFADSEDLPISHVRTPMQHLPEKTLDSNELHLPTPRRIMLKLSRTFEENPSDSKDDSSSEQIASPISPPSSPIMLPTSKARNTRPRFRDSMTYLPNAQHPRQKTRWDPTTGKRVPILTLPSPSTSGEETEGSDIAAGVSTDEDYEGRLSRNLSKTSID